MRFLSLKYIVLSFFAMTYSLGFSQGDSIVKSDLNEMSLEQLLNVEVYSATRKLQRASEAPAIITSITQLQMQKLGAVTLIDVLKFIPGIETSMGSDGFYRLAMRGARKDGEVLVLINNQQINDFYSGKALYDLPIEFIEKIEVIRGPGSALFGTNAMAGVINIFTIKENVFTLSGGNFTTSKANINFATEREKTQFNISVGGCTSDGANALIDSDKVGGQSWSLTHGDLKYKTNRWNKDAYLTTNLAIGDFHYQLFNITRQQGAWVGPVFIAAPGSKLLTNQLATSLHYDFKISDNIVITPKAYANINYHDFLNQETPNGYLSTVSGDLFTNGKYSKEKYIGKTYGGEMDIYIKANEHFDLLTGSVFEDHSIVNYDLTRNYKIVGDEYKGSFANYDAIIFNQADKRRYVFAYFLQGNYKIKKFNITAGLRYDDYNDFGSSFNPRLGVTYKINSKIILKGLYGKAFRAPTFQELYDNTTLGNEYGVKGNTSLTPERINTLELGTEINYKKMLFKYNVFYVKNENLIRVYDPHGGGSIGMYENIGNLNTFGNEAELTVTLNQKLLFFANYSQYISTFTWNKEKVRKADLVFYDKQPSYNKAITNSPTLRLNAGFNVVLKKVSFFVGANYGNECYNNNRFYLEQDHFAHIPYYIQGNFNVAYRVTEKIKLELTANNIGKKFSDPDESTNINSFGTSGMIQPAGTLMLQLKYKY